MFNMNDTLSLQQVLEDVHQRADQNLPDRIIHVSDLRMTREGHLDVPGMGTLHLNGWSRRQLSTDLGLRWNRWFSSATPEEIADEVNRRFARLPGERKLRAYKEDTGEADGVLRAILSPTFAPIDDVSVLDGLGDTMKGVLDEYRFARAISTDTTSHYTAVHTRAFEINDDIHRPGWSMRNSEVGAKSLTIDDFVLREICTNGVMVPTTGGKHRLYRTHRSADAEQIAAAFVIALSRLPKRWDEIVGLLTAAKMMPVPHPDTVVADVLDDASIPRALVEAAQASVLREGDYTRFGVIQAVTAAAHAANRDENVRHDMELRAGRYLSAA